MAAPPVASFPLLERLFEMAMATGPLRLNIEDYLGVFEDIPGLQIPFTMVYHNCSFCLFARKKHQGYADCLANKRAVNRILQRRKASFCGLCHLGVADIVQPVVVDGICVAGLFYGSVVLREKEAESRIRLRAYCQRRGWPSGEYLAELNRLPRVSEADLPEYRRRLETLAELLGRIIVDSGVPLSTYRQEPDAASARKRAGYPKVLQAAMRHLDRCYPQALTRASTAQQIGCNPTYLSTLFTRYLNMTFGQYLNQLRIGKAKALLERSERTAGEIAYAVGYEDQSHFNRQFRQIAGTTPLAYRERIRGDQKGKGGIA